MAYLNFTHEDIEQLRDVFNYFDATNTGFLTAKNLGTTLRCLDPVPLALDIDDMVRHVQNDLQAKLNFQGFLDKVCEVITIVRRREHSSKKKTSCYKNLSETHIQELKDSFMMFDQDGDGTISMEEMSVVMQSLGQDVTEQEIREMVEDVDTTHSGTIDFPEFMTLMTQKKSAADTTVEFTEAFEFFDKDGDGSISADELKTIMLKFGEDLSGEEIQEMIKEADLDGDGQVDYSEFVKMMSCI